MHFSIFGAKKRAFAITPEILFSKPFTFKQFMGFVMPSIFTLLVISLYSIVDGIFVSIFVGSDALAALNIVYPIFNILLGFAIMMATGASAIVAIQMGAGCQEEANKNFSLTMIFSVMVSLGLLVVGLVWKSNMIQALGATPRLYDYALDYITIIIAFSPMFVINLLFEYFIRADGNASLSLGLSIFGGILNIVFDYIFMVPLDMGIKGAAWGTVLGFTLSALIGIWYFVYGKSTLRFQKPKWDFRFLRKASVNGSSQMVTELSSGITTLLFNLAALKYAGEQGVAALTVVLYAQFLLVSVYLGFTAGIAPLISFNYGAKNFARIKESMKYTAKFILISSLVIFAIAQIFGDYIITAFLYKDPAVYAIASGGLSLFSIAFLFAGINIFCSGLFTAFGNGKISTVISMSRSLVCVAIGLSFLPNLLGLNGIWLTIPFAEVITVILSIYFFKHYHKIYHYF